MTHRYELSENLDKVIRVDVDHREELEDPEDRAEYGQSMVIFGDKKLSKNIAGVAMAKDGIRKAKIEQYETRTNRQPVDEKEIGALFELIDTMQVSEN